MKSTLRLRRLELRAGLPRAIARATVQPTPAVIILPTILQSTPFSSSSRHHATTSDFFTSSYASSSTPRPLQLSLPQTSSTGTDLQAIQTLKDLMNTPREQRDESVASKIWRQYSALSMSTRRNLHQDDLRRVLRTVVPSISTLDHPLPGCLPADRIYYSAWERRLQAVMGDMISHRNWNTSVYSPSASTSTSTSTSASSTEERISRTPDEDLFPHIGDYRFLLARLARMGRLNAVESIFREVHERHIPTLDTMIAKIEIQEYRLLALRKKLDTLEKTVDKNQTKHYQEVIKDLDPDFVIFWDVVSQIRWDKNIPRQITCTLLIQIINSFRGFLPKFHSQLDYLNVLAEEVLVKGYGLDMIYFTVREGEWASIHSFVIRAVIDTLGVRGEYWRMLAAYEILMDHCKDVAEGKFVAEDPLEVEDAEIEEDVAPTLSQMEAEENLGRSARGLWGMGTASTSAAPSLVGSSQPSKLPDLPNFAPLAPLPTSRRVYSHFLPSTTTVHPDNLMSLPEPVLRHLADSHPSTQLRTSVISTMIKYASIAKDPYLSKHILETSLRATFEQRTAWLAQTILKARSMVDEAERAGKTLQMDMYIKKPQIKVDLDWFRLILAFQSGRYRISEAPVPFGYEPPVRIVWGLMDESLTWLNAEARLLRQPVLSSSALAAGGRSETSIHPEGQMIRDRPPHLDQETEIPQASSQDQVLRNTGNQSSTAEEQSNVKIPRICDIFDLKDYRRLALIDTRDRIENLLQKNQTSYATRTIHTRERYRQGQAKMQMRRIEEDNARTEALEKKRTRRRTTSTEESGKVSRIEDTSTLSIAL